ncbi:hypothetical protein [Salinivibrio costicola]|jgi:hypothetical protein|uniref:hypothetical protein n=1 Tax=Salinivibrio costicola TaxID=51367 RepID=UPI003F6EB686
MSEKQRATFIARWVSSLEDFLDSDFSYAACHVHCQFSEDSLDWRILSKMSRRGVERINFLGGQYFVRQGGEWFDKSGGIVKRGFISLPKQQLGDR